MADAPKLFRPAHKRGPSGTKFNGRQAIDNLYGKEWEEYRVIFLNVNPDCYVCNKKANIVDHVTPHKGDFKLFWKVDNYLPLCKSHHDTVTNLFDRRHSKGTLPLKKMEWLAGMRMMAGITRKVKVVPFNDKLSNWIASILTPK